MHDRLWMTSITTLAVAVMGLCCSVKKKAKARRARDITTQLARSNFFVRFCIHLLSLFNYNLRI